MLKFKSNKFYFFVAGYSVIFAALAFFGAEQIARSHMQHVEKTTEDRITSATGDMALYALPRMDLTMLAVEGMTHHVRIGINLEINKESVERFESFEPRVSDRIVGYLDHEDLDRFTGPNGITKLRNDILPQINKASKPIIVSDIIFREFVVR